MNRRTLKVSRWRSDLVAMEHNPPWHQAAEAVAALTDNDPSRHVSSGRVHRHIYGDKPLMDQEPKAVVRRWLEEGVDAGVLRKRPDPDHPYHAAFVFSMEQSVAALAG